MSWIRLNIMQLAIKSLFIAIKFIFILFLCLVAIKTADYLSGKFGFVNAKMLDTSWRDKNRYVKLNEFPKNIDTILWPKANDFIDTDNLIQKEVFFRTDGDGFILPTSHKKNSTLDFMFLGGSTTACLFVDENKRFPYLVSNLLNKENDQNVTSLNAGVSGTNSKHSSITLITKILKKRPKYLFILHNINDLNFLLTHQSDYHSTKEEYWIGEFKDLKQGEINAYRRLHSFLFLINKPLANEMDSNELYINIVKFFLEYLPNSTILAQNLIVANFKLADPSQFRFTSSSKKEVSKALSKKERKKIEKAFKQSLKTLVDISSNNGITPILMTQFNRVTKNDKFVRINYNRGKRIISFDSYVDEYSQFNQIIRDVAKEKKIKLIDLSNYIPAEKDFMYDAVHLTNVGSEKVAEFIAENITQYDDQYSLK
jgi:lysophospholipase L1-like esterase